MDGEKSDEDFGFQHLDDGTLGYEDLRRGRLDGEEGVGGSGSG